MANRSQSIELPFDLPELPSDWVYEPLGNLVDQGRGISYGVVQPGAETITGIPIVRVVDIRNNRINTTVPLRVSQEIESKYTRTRLKGREVLITLVGTVGESAIVGPELVNWNVARAVGVLPVSNEMEPEWIHFCVRSPLLQHYIRTWCTTTVQATFNLRDVARLPIPVPPPKVRKKIIDILGTLDDKIELNRRTNETLEAMAKALFQSWFVDFDPVREKAAGRQPAGLDPVTAKLFPDSFEDSPLGKIPKGWRVGTFGEVAHNPRRGIQPEAIVEGTPYIGLEHMPRRCIALSEWETNADLESNKFEFHRGEILFGKLRPYFHKVGVAAVNGVCSTDILVVLPVKADWFGLVLGHASSDEFVAHTDAASSGTKMPRTNWGDMDRYSIVLPPEAIAAKFTNEIQPMIDRIASNVHESRTLAATRDALLPKLLSGELSVIAGAA